MANVLVDEASLQAIAEAIRAKNGTADLYFPAQMAEAILAIKSDPVLATLEITENGVYLPGEGIDGFSQVLANVAGGAGIADGIVVNARDADGYYSDITVYGNILPNQFESYTHLTKVKIAPGVTSIGSEAFKGCTSLTELVLPSTLTSIGASAFSGCTSLTSVTIPASVTSINNQAFYNCTNLATVNWNTDSCTCTSYPPFDKCNNIATINIADGITNIPAYAFYNKNGSVSADVITTVVIPDSVTSIGQYAFSKRGFETITIPAAVASIGNYAFSNCTNLSTLYWNAISCADGSDYPMFHGCTALANIHIAEDVLRIPDYAFRSTSSGTNTLVTSVEIPESVTYIGYGAFTRYKAITSITIPRNVADIGRYAFSECTALTEINWNAVNCAALYSYAIFDKCDSVTNINIADDVEAIPAYAFYNKNSTNAALVAIFVPNSVKTIGNYAFAKMSVLASAQIGNSAECAIATIGANAFGSDTALTDITIYAATDSVSGSPWGATNATITWSA